MCISMTRSQPAIIGEHRERAAGQTFLVTGSVTPGANPGQHGAGRDCDFTAAGGGPGHSVVRHGTHGDAVAGDNIFSLPTRSRRYDRRCEVDPADGDGHPAPFGGRQCHDQRNRVDRRAIAAHSLYLRHHRSRTITAHGTGFGCPADIAGVVALQPFSTRAGRLCSRRRRCS